MLRDYTLVEEEAMTRIALFAAAAFAATMSLALAQTPPGPAPWSAPVGHRQPTASGLAPAVSPDAMAPVMSGRSSGAGGIEPTDRMPALDAGPRICTNCD